MIHFKALEKKVNFCGKLDPERERTRAAPVWTRVYREGTVKRGFRCFSPPSFTDFREQSDIKYTRGGQTTVKSPRSVL